jgi:hypothetical protein
MEIDELLLEIPPAKGEGFINPFLALLGSLGSTFTMTLGS